MNRFNHVPVNLPKLETKTIDKKRFYITPEGEAYPSITTVLSIRKKEGLYEWRKRVGDQVANYVAGKAAARGTAVHHMCEDYLNNQQLDFPSKFEKHKEKFLPYALFNQLKGQVLHNIDNIYLLEGGLYSDRYKIAGRVDCVSEYNKIPSVINFSCYRRWYSTGIYTRKGILFKLLVRSNYNVGEPIIHSFCINICIK